MTYLKEFGRPKDFEKWDKGTQAMWDTTIVPFCIMMDAITEGKIKMFTCKGCGFKTDKSNILSLHILNCPEMTEEYFEENL